MIREDLKNKLTEIYNRDTLPGRDAYLNKLSLVTDILKNEDENSRPGDQKGNPGGIIYLKKLSTVIVPDLHARTGLLPALLDFNKGGDFNVLDRLASGDLQIVCVGDGFHAEARAVRRWEEAFEEFEGGYVNHRNMDEEMKESLGLMEMVFEIKSAFPEQFHFLKGNHENVKNENGYGNYSFGKFVYEGEMVTTYIRKFYGDDFLNQYYLFEKELPVFAVGSDFLISHAEPAFFFSKDEIINYRSNPEVIYGLTWTGNDQAEYRSVQRMLDYYIKAENRSNAYYFGGHRPVNGLYNLRAEGRYVQIHNPRHFAAAFLMNNKKINLDNDIIEFS